MSLGRTSSNSDDRWFFSCLSCPLDVDHQKLLNQSTTTESGCRLRFFTQLHHRTMSIRLQQEVMRTRAHPKRQADVDTPAGTWSHLQGGDAPVSRGHILRMWTHQQAHGQTCGTWTHQWRVETSSGRAPTFWDVKVLAAQEERLFVSTLLLDVYSQQCAFDGFKKKHNIWV